MRLPASDKENLHKYFSRPIAHRGNFNYLCDGRSHIFRHFFVDL